jgi:penicillin-binding protein 2
MIWKKENKLAYENFLKKHNIIFVFCLFLFVCLSLRLFYLQIVVGSKYKKISEQQRLHNAYEYAPRGIIYSADNVAFVKNEFNYAVLFYHLGRKQTLLTDNMVKLSKILEKNVKLVENYKYNRFIKLIDNLTIDEMFKIQEKKLNLEGVEIVKEVRRVYLYPEILSHVLGYISEIKLDELTANGYKIGDRIGRGGIEQFYNKSLKGHDGGWQIEVNSKGYYVKTFKYVYPKIGNSVYTTIDLKLQTMAYNLLLNSTTGRGAIVVIDTRTGAVKTLVSCPGFDANKVGTKDFNRYLKDKKLPLFNRALQALYPPGSIFKIITLTAALELLNINCEEKVRCTGSFELGDRRYSCWYKRGHGTLNLISATAQSCNVCFYQLGLKLGVKNLKKYAKKFYFGKKTEIDLPNEKKGFVPDKKWKKEKMKMPWLKGDTVIFSIGQGALWVTPIQMAHMMSIIANKGECHKPYIVDKIESFDGKKIYEHKKSEEYVKLLSQKTWNILHKALLEVVENGTGSKSKIPGIKIAGKTGTAQNSQGDGHSWFISYAPADNPEIAVAVIIENGGSGGLNAVPIGKKIYEEYFSVVL